MDATFACNERPAERKANSAMSAFENMRAVTSKNTYRGGNGRVEYAVSAMKGHRPNMEDAHATLEDLDVSTATSFFAVYDGHGGHAVAQYCATHFHLEVLNHPEFRSNLPNAVGRAFFRMDELLREQEAREELTRLSGKDYYEQPDRASFLNCFCVKRPSYHGPIDEGCTACVALIRGSQIIVGNAGDSRCVLSRNGQAIALSTDHKPNVPNEIQRIQNAGRSIRYSRGAYRIDDGIAVSRAIGDMKFKKNKDLSPRLQALTCSPEIRSESITDDTEFLAIACDGIWDVLSDQELVDFVGLYIRSEMNLGSVCEALLDHCLARPGALDNMTVILVRLNHAKRPLPTVPSMQEPAADKSTDDEGRSKGKAVFEVGASSRPRCNEF